MASGKAGKPKRHAHLLLLTDPRRQPSPERALGLAPRGAGVIFRAYGETLGRARLRDLGRVAARKGVRLIVAGDEQAARSPGVGGLHLPEHRLKAPSTEHMFHRTRRVKPDLLVTAAAHGEAAIHAAARAGVDAVLISPVFPTESHPDGRALGVVRYARLATIARGLGLAAYALGGMTPASERRLRGTASAGVAGVSLASFPMKWAQAPRPCSPRGCSRNAPSARGDRR